MFEDSDEGAKTSNSSLAFDTAPSQLFKALHDAGIDNLLNFLSSKPESELRLKVNQQIGEPELSSEEKLQLLKKKLNEKPDHFLFQFGRYLDPSHFNCFKLIRAENEDVDFYLRKMENLKASTLQNNVVKNRRYEALQQLVDTTDYFTEEEMQRRNPILYSQLVGRYHTNEEREAFLYQSSQSSSAIGGNSGSRPTPLADMLIAHMNRHEGICSDRRINQQQELLEEKQSDHCFAQTIGNEDDDDDLERDEPEYREATYEIGIEIDESEKDLLREEFFTTMYRHFLEGKDEDFEYENIDGNPDYDVGETSTQDEEDKYFDSEEPESAMQLDTSSESQGSNSIPLIDTTRTFQPTTSTSSAVPPESEEDELELYMKGIENEIRKSGS